MPLPPLRRVFSLTLSLTLLLSACAQPVMWPVSATPAVSVPSTEAAGLVELADRLAAEYGLVQDRGPLVSVQPVLTADGEHTLFVAHTHGFPPDNPAFRQTVSLHAAEPAGWRTLGRVELECAEYLNEFSVEQVRMDAANLWLTVAGGVGAHSGCLELLRWDGQALTVIISGFSSSPDAGSIADLNEDGQMDLLLNNSDPYIFCYACGVRQYWAQLFYWDGQALVEVTPTPLADDQPPELRTLNDRAAALAAAGLFADALAQIEQAEALAPENATVAWNAVWIRHHLEASRAEASASRYPLLNHVFAGDWETAFDALWEAGPAALVSDSPVPTDSAAAGFERIVGALLAQYADTVLRLQPERASVHALGAWGRFLLDPNDPAVKSGLRLAAELAPADERYAALAQAFAERTGAVSAPAAAPRPSAQALQSRLAAEYGAAQDPSRGRGSKATEDRGGGGPGRRLYLWASAPESRRVAHRVAPSSPAKRLARIGPCRARLCQLPGRTRAQASRHRTCRPVADRARRGRGARRLSRGFALGRPGLVARHQQLQQHPRCRRGDGPERRRPAGFSPQQQRSVHILLRLRPAALHGAVFPLGRRKTGRGRAQVVARRPAPPPARHKQPCLGAGRSGPVRRRARRDSARPNRGAVRSGSQLERPLDTPPS